MKSVFIGLLSVPAMFVLGIGFLFLGALTISAFFYIYNKFKFDFSYKKKKEQQQPVAANDNLLPKPKTNKQKGDEYERYIGKRYENKGYQVEYTGLKKGKADGGVDLILHKDNQTYFVQCKNWKETAIIREKYIYQLAGAAAQHKAKGIFYCTCRLSREAKSAARDLNIKTYENFKILRRQ